MRVLSLHKRRCQAVCVPDVANCTPVSILRGAPAFEIVLTKTCILWFEARSEILRRQQVAAMHEAGPGVVSRELVGASCAEYFLANDPNPSNLDDSSAHKPRLARSRFSGSIRREGSIFYQQFPWNVFAWRHRRICLAKCRLFWWEIHFLLL